MSAVREAFKEAQINLLLEALEEKEKRHLAHEKRTRGSGYGKVSTEVKADRHAEVAEDCRKLSSYISTEWN